MDTTRELLAKIRERPGMYLPKPCPILLSTFLRGWSLGRGSVPDYGILNEFQSWVAERYKITTSHGWAAIIEFFGGGGEDAFDLFFDLFEEFESVRGGGS